MCRDDSTRRMSRYDKRNPLSPFDGRCFEFLKVKEKRSLEKVSTTLGGNLLICLRGPYSSTVEEVARSLEVPPLSQQCLKLEFEVFVLSRCMQEFIIKDRCSRSEAEGGEGSCPKSNVCVLLICGPVRSKIWIVRRKALLHFLY